MTPDYVVDGWVVCAHHAAFAFHRPAAPCQVCDLLPLALACQSACAATSLAYVSANPLGIQPFSLLGDRSSPSFGRFISSAPACAFRSAPKNWPAASLMVYIQFVNTP